MALKQLLKRQQLAAAQTAANKHREARAALDGRRSALEKREADAAAALEEAPMPLAMPPFASTPTLNTPLVIFVAPV